jgi:hypothetical protein
VYNRILVIMRNKIRSRQYIMTLHAEEEMEEDELSIFDVESCILTGQIESRQKDVATAEWKYIVNGKTLAGENIFTIGKLSITGMLVLITVYRE